MVFVSKGSFIQGAKIGINRNLKFRQNPFSGFGELSKKFKAIGGQDGHIGRLIGRKNTNFVEGVEDLLSVKFSQNMFSGTLGEVENVTKVNEINFFRPDVHSNKPNIHMLSKAFGQKC